MAVAFFVSALLMLGGWYLMHKYVPYDEIKQPYIVLGLKGVAGALMAAFVCTMASFLFSYNPWFTVPETPDTVTLMSWEDSRAYVCMALVLAFNMIGLPIGFLIGIAKAERPLIADDTAQNSPYA